MKSLLGLIIGCVGFLVTHLSAKNLPLQTRSFGNFKPEVKKLFNVYKPQEQDLVNGTDSINAAVSYFALKTNLTSPLRVASYHTSGHNGVTHIYLQQVINGIDVVNGVANINVGPKGQILSFGTSFYNGNLPASIAKPHQFGADAVEALVILLGHNVRGRLNTEFPVALKYVQVNNGTNLILAWDFVFETRNNMYNAVVDCVSNEVVQLIDWVADASYNVFPLGVNDPLDGDRVIVNDPSHPVASPLGWHSEREGEQSTLTLGNNVYAQENLDGGFDWNDNYRPDGGAALRFDFPLNLELQPNEYLDAAITNLFYWNNVIHDLFYVYGFDEKAGNFQLNNFGNGGKDGDAVIAMVQDGAGTNNAMFLTPPDGYGGSMRMFIWTHTDPYRDGDLDQGIIIHEYLHGVSTRLTGGPDNVGCLATPDGYGMGQGWGDLYATILRVNAHTTRDQAYTMGEYSNGGTGIRLYPYSTDMEVNPATYSYVTRPDYGADQKGEVWAVTLYEIFWNLVEKHGFDADWFNTNIDDAKTEVTYRSIIDGQVLPRPNRNKTLGGNVIFFQLIIDGMKFQPCEPTFVEARDAILQADEANNNGVNLCELWRGFAKRGLGIHAEYEGIESFDLPESCN